jgi:hypothetical protein
MASPGNSGPGGGSPWAALSSFLTSLPGIITAIATLITAIGGILYTMHQIGWINVAALDPLPETTEIAASDPPPAPPPPAPDPSPAPPPSASNPSPAPPPTPEPASPASPSGNVLFEDDFSDTSSGWPQATLGVGTAEYFNGAYRMYARPSPASSSDRNWYTAYSTLGPTGLRDVVAEVDVARRGNAPSNASAFGITCRHVDNDNFYTMGIRSDGSYYISAMKSGSLSRLGLGAPGSAVRSDTSINRIRADCIGSRLTLYVNGQKLFEANDTYHASGRVGLFTNNNATTGPPNEVLFDNFSIHNL